MPSFSFRELQHITSLLLTCDSYMTWSTRFASLKQSVRFSISDSASFFIKSLYFCSTKRHNSFKIEIEINATQNFTPRPLIFKLQQDVLEFNDIRKISLVASIISRKLKVTTIILVMRQHFPQEILKQLDMDYRPSLTWLQKFGTSCLKRWNKLLL